ncbi:protein-L-isoaspartate(D-aspartate) O-methyltransferase [Blastopirellula sp. JC732]|uniref:Protein-L-isoaspartate O-methyltransferase n=1 Tax=Blastopirellula sediminis TaxID=2894196 RepID=A0A9X1MRF7_9BACT|nr:protein-L-isoaspartate(D-aspartate) O-methyltransferase [Blastopirellula sediminis]MCC9606034.1 protein-L-isoaspartate(D-aspartate) O-methyltransferase [Blastopirellula sediminis]MCC9630667.1 protein-L-isoaspartate(D-aspartate) O-methyltransferase [Blastopirellula sediminis]
MYSPFSRRGIAESAILKNEMVEQQLRRRGIHDSAVLAAMGTVPRHQFVPPQWQHLAYEDCAVPLSAGQTISQPYIVALMSQLAAAGPHSRVLDVGAGSGYQSAVLAEMGAEVYAIEILPALAKSAAERLRALGYEKVHLIQGDGYAGWPSEAPFDAILIAAAAPKIPPLLLEQLAVGGRLIVPLGEGAQVLQCIRKVKEGEFESRNVTAVQFVPMVGRIRERER